MKRAIICQCQMYTFSFVIRNKDLKLLFYVFQSIFISYNLRNLYNEVMSQINNIFFYIVIFLQ